MAAILRSSVIQTARHAFSGEGTLSVRTLHTGRKVDPLFKKIDDVARKELVVGYTERLVQELKSSTPSLLGNALQCLASISAAGAFMLGYQITEPASMPMQVQIPVSPHHTHKLETARNPKTNENNNAGYNVTSLNIAKQLLPIQLSDLQWEVTTGCTTECARMWLHLFCCFISEPVAGARIFRQLNNSMKRELTRLRREVGATRVRREVGAVDSLDVMLRDMGYFTRRSFARLFGLFTVLTIMSEGVRELYVLDSFLSLREGEAKEGIMGENFSWLFD